MDVSVIICTCNNADRLRQTLAHLSRCRIPFGTCWEVVAVDNNSRDDTRKVIESMTGSMPVRYVYEPQQGLSRARNCGLGTSSGDLIIFTDDDVIPDSE